MNFKITHNWLLDYIDTDATPEEIQTHLSLSSVNIETIERVGDDYVYDIEVTSNRVDAASVYGIALECVAVLPRNGKPASFKTRPLEKTFASLTEGDQKDIEIQVRDADTVSRVAAVVMSNVQVGASSEVITSRLEACGERSINNVVDISNYLRIALGQPVHIFDYDAITDATMRIEKSTAGDTVVLIDGKELVLPGNDVVIRDGSNRIIDLVGLMGGQNTQVKDTTTNILLFVPVVNKTFVRKTSMSTGHRTAAISYFEKGLDEARVEPTLVYGVELLMEHAYGHVSSPLTDIYPQPVQPVSLDVERSYITSLMNTPLTTDLITDMLAPLGFEVHTDDDETLHVQIPSYRIKDVDSAADIAEEVARIYGYHNIVPEIQKTEPVYQPLEAKQLTDAKEKVRDFLSANGFYEQYNYSMISKADIRNIGEEPDEYLKLSNTISTDIEYMRASLIPSLLKNITENQGKRDMLHFFEIARVYQERSRDLPLEEERLGIVTHADFSILKGVLENIFSLLHIENVSFDTSDANNTLSTQAIVTSHEGKRIGTIGVLRDTFRLAFGIKKSVSIAHINFQELISHINYYPKYTKPNPFAHIKLDITYTSSPEHLYSDIVKKAHEASAHLQSVDVVSQFEQQVSLRLTFAADDRNLTEAEAQAELEAIKLAIK